MTEKSDYLEGQLWRNNIIVGGIAEFVNETWTESEDKVREIIPEKQKMDHRTGKPTTGPDDRPDSVKVRGSRTR